MTDSLTQSEYAILGLLAERPRHGYDLEQVIEERGMREWTELAFSSIYYVLKKLQARGLIEPAPDEGGGRGRRNSYRVSEDGLRVLRRTTLAFLGEPHPVYPSVLLGLANWPCVKGGEAIRALRQRRSAVREHLDRLEEKRRAGPERPQFVDALFDFGLSQLQAESAWIERTLEMFGDDDEN